RLLLESRTIDGRRERDRERRQRSRRRRGARRGRGRGGRRQRLRRDGRRRGGLGRLWTQRRAHAAGPRRGRDGARRRRPPHHDARLLAAVAAAVDGGDQQDVLTLGERNLKTELERRLRPPVRFLTRDLGTVEHHEDFADAVAASRDALDLCLVARGGRRLERDPQGLRAVDGGDHERREAPGFTAR